MRDISRRHFLEKSGIGAILAGLAVPATGSSPPGIELVREQPGGSRSEIARLWTSVLTTHTVGGGPETGQRFRSRTHLENEVVRKRLQYLMQGGFRRDYPELQRGQLPAEAFALSEIRKALQSFSFTL